MVVASKMEAAVKTFFSSPRFLVAGASSDPNKYGNKVFSWYLQHSLPAIPLNPSTPTVTLPTVNGAVHSPIFATITSPLVLGKSAKEYSLSIITPPAVTRKVLKEAKEAGIASVWLQPGSFDRDILGWARMEWPDAAIGGTDVAGSNGRDGWCVLVDGEWGMQLAGKEESKKRKRADEHDHGAEKSHATDLKRGDPKLIEAMQKGLPFPKNESSKKGREYHTQSPATPKKRGDADIISRMQKGALWQPPQSNDHHEDAKHQSNKLASGLKRGDASIIDKMKKGVPLT